MRGACILWDDCPLARSHRLLPKLVYAEQTMAMPAMRRRHTADDVRALTHEDRPWPRYEVIDGELLVTPAPRVAHQLVCTEL